MTVRDYIESNNIRVIAIDLPTTVRAFVTNGQEDFVTICVNSRMPREIQMVALMHEIDHISKGHLWKQDYVEYA